MTVRPLIYHHSKLSLTSIANAGQAAHKVVSTLILFLLRVPTLIYLRVLRSPSTRRLSSDASKAVWDTRT